MLIHLNIQQYALIKALSIDFNSGLTIITGETGAGKSILLGALGLVLGDRAESAALKPNEKCLIEATFNSKHPTLKELFLQHDLDFDDEIILRREINAQGKSRAFINDTPVSLTVLKEIGEQLVDIHRQHETISIKDKGYQLQLLDAFANTQQQILAYKEAFKAWKESEQHYQNLKQEANEMTANLEFNQFQLNELLQAKLSNPNEEQELEQELGLLRNASEIAGAAFAGIQILAETDQNVSDQLHTLQNQLRPLSQWSKTIADAQRRIDSLLIEIEDLNEEFRKLNDQTVVDEESLQQKEDRLSLFYQLKKKHRVTALDELISIQQHLQQKVSGAENIDAQLHLAEKEAEKKLLQLNDAANALSQSRKAAVSGLLGNLQSLVKELGMPNASFQHDWVETPFGPNGKDEWQILFSSNPGMQPMPLHRVASGGELSRIMLCLKSMLANNLQLPTLVFDEVDTGISGEVALKVAKRMRALAEGHQVFAVTHLPQIAAAGHQHYYVFKQSDTHETQTGLKKLTNTERQTEIATMLSGENPGNSALNHANELLTTW